MSGDDGGESEGEDWERSTRHSAPPLILRRKISDGDTAGHLLLHEDKKHRSRGVLINSSAVIPPSTYSEIRGAGDGVGSTYHRAPHKKNSTEINRW